MYTLDQSSVVKLSNSFHLQSLLHPTFLYRLNQQSHEPFSGLSLLLEHVVFTVYTTMSATWTISQHFPELQSLHNRAVLGGQ